MRTVFFGTAEIACPVLRTLSEMPEVNLLGVVSQPDRPKGRKLVLQPTPIKALAERLSLPCHQPPNLRRCEATLGWLQALDLDVIVVMAYGQLLASRVLEMPRRGCVNVHTSL
ncbi:MAG: formyltransferase family protein, partial [Verrucomicrobiota bacterium]|nr:formyltransferase family protein [Verrucomicrobiota bacterium]